MTTISGQISGMTGFGRGEGGEGGEPGVARPRCGEGTGGIEHDDDGAARLGRGDAAVGRARIHIDDPAHAPAQAVEAGDEPRPLVAADDDRVDRVDLHAGSDGAFGRPCSHARPPPERLQSAPGGPGDPVDRPAQNLERAAAMGKILDIYVNVV